MTIQETFIRADRALNEVVQQISDDQWERPLPENLSRGNDKLTLRDVINYHAYDEAWIPAMVEGKTIQQAGEDSYKGDLLGEDPKKNFDELVKRAVASVEKLDDTGRTMHFSYGDYPASEGLKHVTSFRGMRVYDLSKFLGLDTRMEDDLVQGLWDMIHPQAEEWRKLGVFGPRVEVPRDASLQDKLLGLTGRQPGLVQNFSMKLELVMVPVSHVEQAKAFYVDKLGFNPDQDHRVNESLRFVQLTPPGSACSIAIGEGISDMQPGTMKGLQMVIENATSAQKALKKRGVAVSEVEVHPWGSFVYFSDPDGNEWSLQQLPGRP